MNYIKEIRLSDLPHGEYPFNIPAVRHLKKAGGLSLNKPVTFRVLSIRIEKKVNYFYEVTTSD